MGDSIVGNAKVGLGKVLGDDDLAGEGAIDLAAGTLKDAAGINASGLSHMMKRQSISARQMN